MPSRSHINLHANLDLVGKEVSPGEKNLIFNKLQMKGGRLLNYFKGSLSFVVLILVIIAVAFILSILPQEIRWILYILLIACIVIQFCLKSLR